MQEIHDPFYFTVNCLHGAMHASPNSSIKAVYVVSAIPLAFFSFVSTVVVVEQGFDRCVTSRLYSAVNRLTSLCNSIDTQIRSPERRLQSLPLARRQRVHQDQRAPFVCVRPGEGVYKVQPSQDGQDLGGFTREKDVGERTDVSGVV